MRNLYEPAVDTFRDRSPELLRMYGSHGDSNNGRFYVPSPKDGGAMCVLATAGLGWDHVSVSRPNRCPNWPEMEHVKRLFFRDNETAMQLHVPPSDHLSFHPYCLHLWRPQGVEIPRPPANMVAPTNAAEAELAAEILATGKGMRF